MQSNLYDVVLQYINVIFLVFTCLLFLSFLFMAIVFTRISIRYKKEKGIGSISKIMNSGIAPSISIIAPAYNEALTIVENVKSLLALKYTNYEVILVNDGSTDGTLEKIIDSFDLEKVEKPSRALNCRPVRSIYRSKNLAYGKLIVIDKENGGKSDALNAGIYFSEKKYVGCIDVDCLLNPNALLHVVRAFYTQSRKRVVAVGGVIRVANSCKTSEGTVEEIRLPENWLARFQLLEYTRSFLLGRIAWGGIDALLIISGAFGFFERKILCEIGGYDTNTVGEDMEIIFKIRRHMTEKDEPYTIDYLPEPLCWTEVPEEIKILVNQRDRWSRGSIETLRKHKQMFFNPKYGKLGMLSYPYWLFFEWLAPLLEFFGFFTILVFCYLSIINWSFFLALTLAVYSFAVAFSIYAVLWDLLTYRQYLSNKDLLLLILCAFAEPIFFHPIVVFSAVKANYKKLFKLNTGWGTITRKGFSKI